MCPGNGECGRGKVGEVEVRIRLFRLLRQLLFLRGSGRSCSRLRLIIPESSMFCRLEMLFLCGSVEPGRVSWVSILNPAHIEHLKGSSRHPHPAGAR